MEAAGLEGGTKHIKEAEELNIHLVRIFFLIFERPKHG
jgi:hypothetical protein